MHSSGPSALTDFAPAGSSTRPPVGLRGWLLVYMVGLIFQALHGLGLTVGSVVVYAHPSLGGRGSSVPLGALVFYVAANVSAGVYTAVVLGLMVRRRRAAVVNSIILNCLVVLFLVSWRALGEKSGVGVVVDSLPGLVGIAYVLRSRRVRGTLVYSRVSTHSRASARVS